MALPQNQSIVDFLTKRKFVPKQGEQFPLFGERESLFGELGLTKDLGEFRGSDVQNLRLLKELSGLEETSKQAISPLNIRELIRSRQAPLPQQVSGGAQGVLAGVQPQAGEPPVPKVSQEVYERFFGKQLTGEETAVKGLEEVLSAPSFPFKQEAAEAEKAELVTKGKREAEEFIAKLGSRGLFFSGKKVEGLAQIEADTLAKQLGVDRKFARMIVEGMEQAGKTIAKEAQKGDPEAVAALKAMGFTINPFTGEIVPTMEAQREERALRGEERAEKAAELAEKRFELREEQFGLSQERFVESIRQFEVRMAEQARREEERGNPVESRIFSRIGAVLDSYKIQPEGYRERLIESLIATEGEEWRPFIEDQVYLQLPDIESKELKEARAFVKAWKVAGKSIKDIVGQYRGPLKRDKPIPGEIVQAIKEIYGQEI